MSVRESCWMLVSAFLFALMALFAKLSTAYYGVMEIIFYRSVLGVLFVGAQMAARHISFRPHFVSHHIARCLVGTLSISLGVYVLGVLPLGTAQTLAYTSPLFFSLFIVIAARRAGKAMDWPLLAAVAVGFVGAVLILRPDFSSVEFMAVILGLCAGMTGAGGDWGIRDLSLHKEPNERIVFYFTLTGTVFGTVITLFTPEGFHSHSAESIVSLLMVGVAGTAAQLTLTRAWQKGQPLVNTVFQFSGIVFALILGALVFGEKPDTVTFIGIAVVFAAGLTAGIIRVRNPRLN